MSFPASDRPVAETTSAAAEPPVRAGRVLVVDDEAPVRRVITRILQRAGYEVVTAAEAVEARAELATSVFDAMLCDLWMPGETGLSLATWAAMEFPGMAVLVVTASDDPAHHGVLARSQIQGLVTKPFEATGIVVNLTRAIDRVRARHEETTRLRRRLAEQEGMWEALVDGAPVGVLLVDLDSGCYFVNAAAERMVDRPSSALVGDGWRLALGDIAATDAWWGSGESSVLTASVAVSDGVRHLRLGRRRYPAAGEPEGFIVVMEDVTELVAHQHDLEYRAFHDEATGLPNRASLAIHVRARLSERPGGVVAAVVEVDRFESAGGVPENEAAMVALGAHLVDLAGEGAITARTGTHEFVILAGEGEQGARELAAALRDGLHAATVLRVDGGAVTPVVAMGVVRASAEPEGGDATEALLRDGRFAAARARTLGPARVELLDPELRDRVLARLELERELRGALAEGGLRAEYQPVFTVAGGRLLGFESLCRWDHPRLGPVPPDVFVPIAEEVGLGPELGRYMLRVAIEQLALWDDALGLPPDLRVGVNLTAGHVAEGDLCELIEALCARTGMSPTMVLVELTERSVMADLDHAAGLLADLRALGVAVALDDFGTGYSSLGYLARLPVDVVKVDRSFTMCLGAEDPGRAGVVAEVSGGSRNEGLTESIVRAIVSLAGALRCEVVAEGVETLEQRSVLVELGVDAVQGYLFGRPMRPDDPELERLIREPMGPR